jgi:hypothetical protein
MHIHACKLIGHKYLRGNLVLQGTHLLELHRSVVVGDIQFRFQFLLVPLLPRDLLVIQPGLSYYDVILDDDGPPHRLHVGCQDNLYYRKKLQYRNNLVD